MSVGSGSVTLREPSGRIRTAAILDRADDEAGRPVRLLLDRVAHPLYGEYTGGWMAAGVFVTEMARSPESAAIYSADSVPAIALGHHGGANP